MFTYLYKKKKPLSCLFAVRGMAFFRLIEQMVSIKKDKGTQM